MITTVIRASLLGLLMGYGAGYIGKILLRKMSTDRLSILVMCFGIPLFTYAISEAYISGYGVTSVLMVGIMMGLERTSLPQDIDKFLTNMWKVVGVLMDIVVILWAAIFMAIHSIPLLNWTDGVLILVTYLMYYLIRFVCFLLFSPILSRLGYGMNLKNMIVCVWAGLKAPFSLILGVHLINARSETDPVARKFMSHYFSVYVLALLINGSFLRTVLNFMGLTKISMARQVNMNNCMKHIFNKRERTVAILKMDR
jgi:sodium/hydrogen exchanger 10/11